jgi:deoxypyrimidine-specific 5' nucleotidase type C protein (NT5C)
MRERPKLFLDLDGVLADFDGGFPRIFGEDHRHIGEDRMWELVRGRPDFFAELHAFPGAVEFFRAVAHLQPAILTAAPKSDYMNAALAKRRWVRTHIDPDVLVLPVMGGRNKPAFLDHPGDILIDDYGRNCDLWEAAGGVAIKHEPGDFARTLDLLRPHYEGATHDRD